ncbi:putative transcriptional regulator [Methanomicrobium sp. W14]|uniref:winged helix-turn-helix transcriptional regulator n=1 Tax=Methanomicrobium sp. W14 TaxID=2817839 RepID=UPI001AEA4AE8|nr:winged helix-turn-helix transcriptional regulator [Methanomicrobium sp. W14]MBP2133660.1 putative transcriptional regulator [Methanomicrobium sp. W14]
MNLRGPVIALVLILILVYIHQASVDSNIIVTPSADSPDFFREDNVRALNWWEVTPIQHFISIIGLYSLYLIPIASVITIITGFFFGIKQIKKNNVLENERREDIVRIIKSNPGITLGEIENITRINHSSLRYHLKILFREGKIFSTKQYKRRHYFGRFNDYNHYSSDKRIISDCPKTEDILRYISMNPGCTQRDLMEYTKLSSPTISWHIGRLSSNNLIDIEKEKNSNHYYVTKKEGFFLSIKL